MSRNSDRERLKNKVTSVGGSGSQASIKAAATKKTGTTTTKKTGATTTKKTGTTTVPAYGGSTTTKGVGSTIPGTTTPSLSGALKSAMSDFAKSGGSSWKPSTNPSGAVTPSTPTTGGSLGSGAASAAVKSAVGAALGGVGGGGTTEREAESTPSQVTAVSAPASGGGEYSGGVTDLSDYLRQQQQAATEAALAALKSAYDKNSLLYSHQRSQLSPLYDAQRNQLASDVARARMAYDERALSSGLNTGTAGQADLARSSVMQQGMADIGQAEADALAEIDLARAQLQAEYENAIAQKKAEDGAALLEQLYKEAVRQDNARMSQAATPSYTTVSVPAASGNGGSSGETSIDRLKVNSRQSGGSTNSNTKNSNGLVSFGGYKNTTAYERALSYAKAGAQARRTANLLNGYVKSGQITSGQANQIMSELY